LKKEVMGICNKQEAGVEEQKKWKRNEKKMQKKR
jgi:hypothetical protein